MSFHQSTASDLKLSFRFIATDEDTIGCSNNECLILLSDSYTWRDALAKCEMERGRLFGQEMYEEKSWMPFFTEQVACLFNNIN